MNKVNFNEQGELLKVNFWFSVPPLSGQDVTPAAAVHDSGLNDCRHLHGLIISTAVPGVQPCSIASRSLLPNTARFFVWRPLRDVIRQHGTPQ
jgi:hypothetical protein